MRSAGGLSPAKCRSQGIGATFFFAGNVKIYFVKYYCPSFPFVSSVSIFSMRSINQMDAPTANGNKMYWIILSLDRGVGCGSGRELRAGCVGDDDAVEVAGFAGTGCA